MTKEYDMASSPFSWDKLDGLLAYKSSLITCSDILDCPSSTIQNHIRKRFDMNFSEYSDRKLSRTKAKLVSKAIEMATAGNVVMMIFCLKNIAGWQDKLEHNVEGSGIQITYKKAE